MLEGRFPPLVIACVKMRAVDPGYFATLSPASVQALVVQGKPGGGARAAVP